MDRQAYELRFHLIVAELSKERKLTRPGAQRQEVGKAPKSPRTRSLRRNQHGVDEVDGEMVVVDDRLGDPGLVP